MAAITSSNAKPQFDGVSSSFITAYAHSLSAHCARGQSIICQSWRLWPADFSQLRILKVRWNQNQDQALPFAKGSRVHDPQNPGSTVNSLLMWDWNLVRHLWEMLWVWTVIDASESLRDHPVFIENLSLWMLGLWALAAQIRIYTVKLSVPALNSINSNGCLRTSLSKLVWVTAWVIALGITSSTHFLQFNTFRSKEIEERALESLTCDSLSM